MSSAIEIYEAVVHDTINSAQNGDFSYAMFNRLSPRAELRVIDFLTGKLSGAELPIPWSTQKDKDFLSFLITKYSTHPSKGEITRPSDYYMYENFYRVGSKNGSCDDEEGETDDCNTIIELLNGDQFNERCTTYIDELKPTINKPIAKQIGKNFELIPKDLGPVILEYIRYPKYASITPKIDPVYNEEVPDVVVDYEWDDNVKELLIYFITDLFFNRTREQAGKIMNESSNPKKT